MNILVAGGFDSTDTDVEEIRQFCRLLGREIIRQGHCLINGCWCELDTVVAGSAYEELQSRRAEKTEVERRIISYVNEGSSPVHEFGSLIRSRLSAWDPASGTGKAPEPIQRADSVILVRGYGGTLRAAHWAVYARKPIVPVAYFGGAARELYLSRLDSVEEVYVGRIQEAEFQQLDAIGHDYDGKVDKLVNLAEKVATSKKVLAIMPFAAEGEIGTELENLYDTFQIVCRDFDYTCERVDESTKGRILPRLLRQIDRAAFIIADLTNLRPNVFYELGYSNGLRKEFVITAKEGTELPFDVRDMPTTFWRPNNLKQLRTELRSRIQEIAQQQG